MHPPCIANATGDKPATYTDFRKMLDERKDIDATVIATPVDTHKMIAIDALEVGKNVYCEKPMATTPGDVRLMVGADHRLVLPASAFGGAAFLVLCDTISRTALSPLEVPVGVITAIIGGPFFLWLLIRNR